MWSSGFLDYKKSPFFLRDSKASETRARVKITPREKGETRFLNLRFLSVILFSSFDFLFAFLAIYEIIKGPF